MQSRCKVGSDPASGCGARPLLRAAAVLLGPPRAGNPFEMRGAADHWSPGWEWEQAAAPNAPLTRKGSPRRSDPSTALELARCWCGGYDCGKKWGASASLLDQRRDDEGGKLVRNRPAPLRGPGRSRRARPAGSRGAGTARSDPGGAGAASGRRAVRLDGLFVPGRQPPDPAAAGTGGYGAPGQFGERTTHGPGQQGGGWLVPAAASPHRDARGEPRRQGPGRGRSEYRGRTWRVDTDVERIDPVTRGLRSCERAWRGKHPLLPGPELLKRSL